MPRRSRQEDPEKLRLKVIGLLTDFESKAGTVPLRAQVNALIPAFDALRDLGASLVSDAGSGSGRILAYLRAHPAAVISVRSPAMLSP